jgi:aryl-alcohol dehydrogenase-like predicted oxidoreductase
MKTRKLGSTGIEVSEIAFGGVEIGIPYGIGVHDQADMLSEKSAIELLHTAIDEGINFFDTARLYGESERIMGNAFKDRRHEVVLCSKCTHIRDEKGKILAYPALKKTIEDSLQESLKMLQTDHLDVFMLHQADLEILENDFVSQIVTDLKTKGIINATGVSVYVPEETKKAIEKGAWDVVQLPFNLMDQRQKDHFDLAAEKGVAIVIRSVLMKGLLSDRGKNLHPALAAVESFIQNYQQLLGPDAQNLPSLATKFALSFDAVAAVLVGIDKLDYLYQSIQSANGNPLDPQTVKKGKQLSYPEPDFLNLANWHKMGWLV